MYIYQEYYILVDKEDDGFFLTEDKGFTEYLDHASIYDTKYGAKEAIREYKVVESDEYYSGDFYVGNQVEVRKVEVKII